MKLLLDNHLSPKLVNQLAAFYPDSSHVALLGLDRASDDHVWQIAHDEGYCLVTKAADFNEILAARGFPPKVVWIRLGNCTTTEIFTLLQDQHEVLLMFFQDPEAGLLELRK